MASFSAQQKMFIQNLEKNNFVQKIMRHEMFQVFLMPLDESFICEGEKNIDCTFVFMVGKQLFDFQTVKQNVEREFSPREKKMKNTNRRHHLIGENGEKEGS